MEIIDPNGTHEELESIISGALQRDLTPIEQEIINTIVHMEDEKRIAFLEMMKELINKHRRHR